MVTSPAHSKIFILDFGSQYTQVIARRVRELQVYSEIVRFDISAAELAKLKANGIILSGGPASVYDKGAPQVDPQIFSLGIPVLGICYGMQLMAHHLGGQVEFSARREYGAAVLHVMDGSRLFEGLGPQLDIWNSHGDKVTALPAGFHAAARTENSPFAAIENTDRNLFAVQFHAEVAHTPRGKEHAIVQLAKDNPKTAIRNQQFRFLAQGTLYPDVIESVSIGGNPASLIKSHHNVGGLPEKMHFELVEPVRQLFKDEVRQVGLQLGLPKEIVYRQPFPGPGLAVRILGEVKAGRLSILRDADTIVQSEMEASDWYYRVWQSFAVLLPVQSVGVMGDQRTYDYTIALRIVESQDGMTADWVRLPFELLARISNRIVNEVKGVNRVVLDISTKPPSTI